MRFIIIVFAVLLGSNNLNAQAIGGRVGYGMNNVSFDSLTIQSSSGVDTFRMTINQGGGTIYAGLFFRMPLGAFYLQAEPLFTSYTYNTRLRDIQSPTQPSTVKRERFNSLDLSLSAGVRLFNALRIQGGATGHFLINYNSEVSTFIPEYNAEWSNLMRSVHGGIGFDIANMTLDFQYERTLEGLGDDINFYDQPYSWNGQRNRFLIKLGVRISGSWD